jgi:hypothetical protein
MSRPIFAIFRPDISESLTDNLRRTGGHGSGTDTGTDTRKKDGIRKKSGSMGKERAGERTDRKKATCSPWSPC